MLSDLLIGPSPTCQHGNRKLHRRQLPCNLSPVFRIMKRHPAPAERKHPFRDPLIRLRIPVPDTCLDQPPQKPMMLNKRLQKPIHLRQLPAPEHLLLRLLLMLSVDRTHRHHTVNIRHTDRIRPLRHKQSSLPHPISTPYLPVKISMVRHHIRGKKPQPLRKHPAVLPKSRHPIRRQMKQNRPHIPRQKTGRINILRNLLLHSNLHTGLDPLHPPLSRRHIPQRQIRIPIQNTRRKLQLNNPAGQIPPRDLTTLLRLPRKIKKLTPPTSSAAPMPHHLPTHHKETQPLQPSSAALMAHHPPVRPPHLTPQKPERTDCQRGGCMVGTRCVGVSRWSYLAPGASDGKVLCGHKPQSKPHLSEPGTHQRTWRVMGRPARQKAQTLSMPRRNDRTRHDHAAAPLADCPFVPPSIHPSHPHKKRAPRSKHPGTLPKLKYPIIINRYQLSPTITQHAAETSESPSHWKPSRSPLQDS